MTTVAVVAALLGITGVLCYVAVVSLSNSHTWLGLIALLAAILALVKIGSILATNLPGQKPPRTSSRETRWWERLL